MRPSEWAGRDYLCMSETQNPKRGRQEAADKMFQDKENKKKILRKGYTRSIGRLKEKDRQW